MTTGNREQLNMRKHWFIQSIGLLSLVALVVLTVFYGYAGFLGLHEHSPELANLCLLLAVVVFVMLTRACLKSVKSLLNL